MRALALTNDRKLALVERAIPTIRDPFDVLVKITQTGICGTDRGILLGRFPAEAGVVLGHESVGVVVETGRSVSTVQTGQRVVINPTLYCGRCVNCARGRTNFCSNKRGTEVGVDRDGAFADYIVLPEAFVCTISGDLSHDQAIFVEPLACVLNNLDAAELSAGETVVIIGGGPVGAVTAMAARFYGAEVHVVEPNRFRKDVCSRLLLSDEQSAMMHDPGDTSLRGIADVVVDTVGSQLGQSLDYCGPMSRCVVMGFNSNDQVQFRPLDIVQRGIRIIGAGDYRGCSFVKALGIAPRLPLGALVTHHIPIQDFETALDLIGISPSGSYSAMKVAITLDPSLIDGEASLRQAGRF